MSIEWTNDRAELDGFTLVRSIEPDLDQRRPWEEEDGHGPVREARGQTSYSWTPAKRPGELVLASERNWALFYDFQEACRIARKEAWNAEPYDVPGETPRQRAAKAALANFNRLRQFCAGHWSYVGVAVVASRDDLELGRASLWGIEDDAGDYLDEVADELVPEALDEARTRLERLCDCQPA
jgi:hypothetical protein